MMIIVGIKATIQRANIIVLTFQLGRDRKQQSGKKLPVSPSVADGVRRLIRPCLVIIGWLAVFVCKNLIVA